MKFLRKINKRESFLLGDFNHNILDGDEPKVTNFIDVMYDHGFSSSINRPTRITDDSSTLLDQIWPNSNTPQKVKSCIITFSTSDHLATMMCIAKTNIKALKQVVSTRASERKISRGYEGRYRAPKSYWAPQALSGLVPLNYFCSMGVDLHLKVSE